MQNVEIHFFVFHGYKVVEFSFEQESLTLGRYLDVVFRNHIVRYHSHNIFRNEQTEREVTTATHRQCTKFYTGTLYHNHLHKAIV